MTSQVAVLAADTGVNGVALAVLVVLFLLVTVAGFMASRFKRADSLESLDEWGLGGRSFGTWITWFLPGMSRAERDEQVRALMATSTGEGTLARQVDALVSPVSSLTADSILTMLDSLAPHAAE